MPKVTLVKSLTDRRKGHIATTHALGFRKIGKTIEYKGTSQIKGIISRISYLLKVEEA